jgi:hypothetical protein
MPRLSAQACANEFLPLYGDVGGEKYERVSPQLE